MTHQERFSSLMQEAAILLDQLILLLQEERSSPESLLNTSQDAQQ